MRGCVGWIWCLLGMETWPNPGYRRRRAVGSIGLDGEGARLDLLDWMVKACGWIHWIGWTGVRGWIHCMGWTGVRGGLRRAYRRLGVRWGWQILIDLWDLDGICVGILVGCVGTLMRSWCDPDAILVRS